MQKRYQYLFRVNSFISNDISECSQIRERTDDGND
jgi:hypothetical protein